MNSAYLAALALIFAAGPLCAQLGEIRGVVVEAGTLHPIAGARVLYMRMPDGQPLSPTESEVLTNQTGTFRITPTTAGNYQLSVTKEGYPRVSKLVALSPANPSGDVRIEITPLSLVTGRVIDRNTGDPASAQISLEAVRHENGCGPLGSGLKVIVPVTIGVDGVFSTPNVPPGLYGLVIKPLLWSKWSARHTVEFEDTDREIVDEDYEYSFWPGSGRKEAVLPLQVAASRTDAGSVVLRKTRYYRAHIAFDGSACASGDVFRARLMTADVEEASEEQGRFDVKCGQNSLLRGLAPGSYRFDLAKQGNDVAGRLFGTVSFVITDKNLDLRVTTAPGLSLHGSVRLVEGIKAQPPAIRVNAARTPFAFPEERQTVPWTAKGASSSRTCR